jgi:hypothetical protein
MEHRAGAALSLRRNGFPGTRSSDQPEGPRSGAANVVFVSEVIQVLVAAADHPWRLDINAGASILTAASTVALAVTAFFQIRASRQQAAAAQRQGTEALTMSREQADAAIRIATETRKAAQRQWQPRVHARYHSGPTRGGWDAADDEIAVPYYLVNEGTGPAFNVTVGIEVVDHIEWREQGWWSMQANEYFPPLESGANDPVPEKALKIFVDESKWDPHNYAYVTRFENLLGEHFEVRDYPPGDTRHAEFREL